jgi:hypothetical protein
MEARPARTRRALVVAVAIGALGLALIPGIGVAGAKTIHVGSAATLQRRGKKAPGALDLRALSLPAGYVVVAGNLVDAPNLLQTVTSVKCPKPTKPIGGGAFVDSTSTLANVNTSYPIGNRSWAVDVNNASGDYTTIHAWAVCVARPSGKFTVASATFANPANTQTQGIVNCPSGVVVGGGAFSNGSTMNVNINSMFPLGQSSWRADMNNGSGDDEVLYVYAVCRNEAPKGYSVQVGAAVVNPPSTQTRVSVACPGASVPLSGGVYSTSGALTVNMNESIPSGQSWLSYENNGSLSSTTATPYAICAGK